jgi:16S rRNA (guanine527-N7)-methyltransferase
MERGVIGPSEAPRIWERHLLNSAAIADAFAPGAHVVDVGSGAGLPGIPLALARPDLTVTLLESLTRRVAFLDEVVEILDLAPRVRTVKARAEEHRQQYDAVTARAVAPLDKLGRWTARLVPSGGVLIAIRGANAVSELKESRMDLTRSGWKDVQIDTYGDEPSSAATVIRAVRR